MKKKAGLADSPFFTPPISGHPAQVAVFPEPEVVATADSKEIETGLKLNDSTVARYHDTAIELLRRCVKEFGKEAATHRFTLSEKRALANIIHSLGMQGVRTTENEITRIAINFVIDEFNRRGKDSLLARVLQALNQ